MLKRLRHRLRTIEPAEFHRMEAAAASVTQDLLGAFRGNFKGALGTMDGLMARPDYWDAGWRRDIHRLAHDLRGLGGTFNYGLVSTIGDSLCRLVSSGGLSTDRPRQRSLAAHVAAMKAILQFNLNGDGGGQGEALLATLKIDKTNQPR